MSIHPSSIQSLGLPTEEEEEEEEGVVGLSPAGGGSPRRDGGHHRPRSEWETEGERCSEWNSPEGNCCSMGSDAAVATFPAPKSQEGEKVEKEQKEEVEP